LKCDSPAPHKTPEILAHKKINYQVVLMELHPLLSQLDKTDLDRYMNACKEDLIDFLEDLGLNNALALKVLEDVQASLS
jgi:hypothetical protein